MINPFNKPGACGFGLKILSVLNQQLLIKVKSISLSVFSIFQDKGKLFTNLIFQLHLSIVVNHIGLAIY